MKENLKLYAEIKSLSSVLHADPELFAGEGVPTNYFVYRRGG